MPKFEDRGPVKCSFCGKSQDEVHRIIAGPGVYICNECVELCQEIYEEDVGNIQMDLSDIPKPADILSVLNQYVVGQDAAASFVRRGL
jgi:ATP-dependent Clp protease ATP-binding subunit ClpX